MLKPDCLRSRNGHAAGLSGCRWFLPIFVAILCTNLTGQAPALAGEEPFTSLASITRSSSNQQVTVQAVVSSIREPSSDRAPYTVTLTEGGATLPLVYWSDIQPQVGPKMKVGNLVRAKVTVNIYRDRLQLRVRTADAVELIKTGVALPSAPAATGGTNPPTPVPSIPTTPPTETVIGKIKGDWAGRGVIISGTISANEDAGIGRRLSVADATGEIPVLLGERVMSGLVAADLQPGRALTVTGQVKLLDAKPVVIPDNASGVRLVPQ